MWSDSLALAGDPYPEAHLISNVIAGLRAEYLLTVYQIERNRMTWQEMRDIRKPLERYPSLETTN